MYTERYQIIKIVKEPGEEPKVHDWDTCDFPVDNHSWLFVYRKDRHSEEEPVSFLGTRFMTDNRACCDLIHVSQIIIPRIAGMMFFMDVDCAKELRNYLKEFMFSIPGWVIPIENLSIFLEWYMDKSSDSSVWGKYYRRVKYFDDFEGSGKILIAAKELC